MINIPVNNNWLYEQSRQNPDVTAIVSKDITLSYLKLYNKVSAVSEFFRIKKIFEGDNVTLISGQDEKLIIVLSALWNIGAVPVPLNIRNSIGEMTKQIEFCDSDFIICSPKYFDQLKNKYGDRVINIKSIKEIPVPENVEPRPYFPDDTALVMFTSGSTGVRKAVVSSFSNLYYNCDGLDKIIGLKPGESWLASIPFYHIGGLQILTRMILSGGTVILPDTLKTNDLLQSIKKHSPVYISVVNTTLQRIIEKNIIFDKRIKGIFAGGGPINNQLLISALDRNLPVYKVYGSTETSSMITILKPEDLKCKIESAGKAAAGIELKIFNGDKNNSTGFVTGEIGIKGKSIFQYYYKNEKLTYDKFNKSYYLTGDIGYIDNEGFLFVLGRKDSFIITGGEKVNPAEVENVLNEMNKCEEVKVFGIRDDEWGEIVCAAIVTSDKSNLDENELKFFLKEKIADYKIPKKYIFPEKLPRTDLGKIDVNKLKELL